jgi:hypothetical protein
LDNPSTESSTSALNIDGAAAAFGELLTPKEPEAPTDKDPVEAEAEKVEAPEVEDEATEAEDDPLVTIKVDGKEVQVPLSELKLGYQRQSDYTKKTMEVSEQRKAAEAETQKAQAERNQYAQNLQRMQSQIEVALQDQQQIDWQSLLNTDPQEYLRQRHLLEQRQAAWQQNQAEQQKLGQVMQAEAQTQRQAHIQAQQEILLAKLPEWKDEAKASAEKAQIGKYLIDQGYDTELVNNLADANMVITARKAMLFDQMVAKAKATTKKVETLPTKVEKPGTGANPGLDKRASAYQRLGKSGSVEDAASVFSTFI